MNAGKSTALLQVAHNYEEQGQAVRLYTAAIDSRYGVGQITSRLGPQRRVDVFDAGTDFLAEIPQVACLLIDEAQFLSTAQVQQLHQLAQVHGVPVICYGLRTDFKTRLFPGAQRLMELADGIEEVKVTCQYCQRKAICNLRFVGGVPTLDGPQIQLGADESYAPVCWTHYDESTRPLAQDVSGATLRPS